MPGVEDLVDTSLPFPIKPSSAAQDEAIPQLPPQMQSVRSHTTDQVVDMIKKTPLFMTSLEDIDDGALLTRSHIIGGFSSKAVG